MLRKNYNILGYRTSVSSFSPKTFEKISLDTME